MKKAPQTMSGFETNMTNSLPNNKLPPLLFPVNLYNEIKTSKP